MEGARQSECKVECSIRGEISTVRDLEDLNESIRISREHLMHKFVSMIAKSRCRGLKLHGVTAGASTCPKNHE